MSLKYSTFFWNWEFGLQSPLKGVHYIHSRKSNLLSWGLTKNMSFHYSKQFPPFCFLSSSSPNYFIETSFWNGISFDDVRIEIYSYGMLAKGVTTHSRIRLCLFFYSWKPPLQISYYNKCIMQCIFLLPFGLFIGFSKKK